DGAVRPRAAPRRARAGAGAPADHARIGGPMSPLARMPGWPSRRPVRSWLPPIVLSGVAVAIGCNRAPQPDAYGNVEATEVVVSAEAAGRLTTYTVVEGQTLSADAVVATIDTTQLNIEREQAAAQRSATASRVNEVRQQIAVLEAQRAAATAQRDAAKAQRDALASQHEIAKRAYDRTNRLFAEQAATSQQLDQTERDYRVLGDQIKAQDEQLRAHERQIAAQADQIRAARAQVQTAEHQVASADAQ